VTSFRECRISLADAARLLGVRASELREAIQTDALLRGEQPPQPMYKTGPGGWVFRAGEVMDVAERLGRSF